MYKNYIWDFDGTLFDTYPKMEKALKDALLQHKCHVPSDLLFQILETSVREVIQKIPFEKQKVVINTYHQFERKYQKNPQPFVGVHDILEKIVQREGKHFLFTHRDESAKEILRKNHLETYFDAIITSEDYFKRKPNPEGLFYLLDHYHLRREETLMIGDRKLDIEFGKNGGIKTVWFNSYQQPLHVQADFEIQSLKEILTIGG